jgi:hypothetical protein
VPDVTALSSVSLSEIAIARPAGEKEINNIRVRQIEEALMDETV